MPIKSVIGTETEFGITSKKVEGYDPVSSSLFIINHLRPFSSLRVLWDYENEDPLVDARGFTAEGEKESPAQDQNLNLNKPLENGGRLYVDGAHPEYSTPECTNPKDVVIYEKAGERLMHLCLENANRLRKEDKKLLIYKNNTDGKGNSYGYHENYLMLRSTQFDRLHIIVGDANMSEFTTYLKIGTTALVLQMIDNNREIAGLELENPLQAIKAISRDMSLKKTVKLANGKEYTPVEIQKAYLEQAYKYFGNSQEDPLV